MTDSPYPIIAADDFARRFSMRPGGLMWLGAGASAAVGIPTAWNMLWEFKQQPYVSQRRVSPRTWQIRRFADQSKVASTALNSPSIFWTDNGAVDAGTGGLTVRR